MCLIMTVKISFLLFAVIAIGLQQENYQINEFQSPFTICAIIQNGAAQLGREVTVQLSSSAETAAGELELHFSGGVSLFHALL